VADDEFAITRNLEYALAREGYAVSTALDGEHALELFRREKPAVAILDILMPGINGLKLMELLRRESPEILVILLTSMHLESDIRRGLDGGADRYLLKETTPMVVVSNVNAMLRSKQLCGGTEGDVCRYGKFAAHREGHRLEIDGTALPCTLYEFRLMLALIDKPLFTYSRDRLLDVVYGEESPTDRCIDQLVRRIRHKAKAAGLEDPVRTVPTIGYQLGEARRMERQ
jgi:DNA-binding response OmpR family regulator